MLDLVAILAIALLGGLLPLLARWGERGQHTALALSTGIFLGAVFLHFLPALSELSLGHGAESGHHHGGDPWLWLIVLVGVLGIYLFEALVLRTHDHDELHRHRAVSWGAFLGLAVHALTSGVSYGAARQYEEVSDALLMAIVAHKGFEAFSLTTVFLLAAMSRARLCALVVGFSLVTPVGILLGDQLTAALGDAGTAVLTALAAGTFLYVCLCELLVEVFHHREDSGKKIFLLALGIALTFFFEQIGGV